MSASSILLVIFSGLGVIHGLFLAAFLWSYREGHRTSNRILSLLLAVLSFRIGKSVLLEFSQDLDIKLIFTGLATLMAIGPLFYGFTRSMTDKVFRFQGQHIVHYIPAMVGILFGLLIDDAFIDSLPTAFFIGMFIVYYGHYLVYLLISYLRMTRANDQKISPEALLFWRWLFYGLLIVWTVYVLNLFDEVIPYVVGPILYTCVAYVVSFVVIRNGYLKTLGSRKYKTNPVSEDKIDEIFKRVKKIVVEESQFKNPDLTLKSLSEKINVTPQVLSLVINRQSRMNFNNFVNGYRVDESRKLLQDEHYLHRTIASIALDVGFNSITSFNTAFKKHTGKTPVAFRKELIKHM